MRAAERVRAAASLRAVVAAVEAGEIDGDEFDRGYLLATADTLDPAGVRPDRDDPPVVH